MEPLKQLMQITAPQHFRPTVQAGDSEESFLAYLGQPRPARSQSSSGEESSQVELSPLARLLGTLSSEGRQALIDLLGMLPEEGQSRQQLGGLLSLLASEKSGEEIEPTIGNLRELFARLGGDGNDGSQPTARSLRELSQLTENTQRYFFDSLDDFLNLSSRDLTGLLAKRDGLSKKEYEDFLRVLSNLLKRGVVGTEEVRFRDQKRKTFVTTRLGDSRLRRAEPHRRGRFPLDHTERKRPFER